MNKFLPQCFNDFLALLLIILIAILWVIEGLDKVVLRDDVNGALVVLFTLVVQYYFRKAPTPTDTTTSTTTTTSSVATPPDTAIPK